MTASRPDFNDSSILHHMKALIVTTGVVIVCIGALAVDIAMGVRSFQRNYFNE